MDKNKCGVFYIATGKEAISDALHSAESVKKYCPDLSCTILADEKVEGGRFDHVMRFEGSTLHKRLNKPENLSKSPYEYTLYLDNDTKVNHDLWELFEILDQFDIAMVQDFSRKRKVWSEMIPDYASIPYSFPEYCSGLILFKKSEKTKQLFDSWKELFKIFEMPLDQPTLRVALWRSALRIHTLPIEYNIRNRENRSKWDDRKKSGEETEEHLKPRVFHWRGIHDPGNPSEPHSY